MPRVDINRANTERQRAVRGHALGHSAIAAGPVSPLANATLKHTGVFEGNLVAIGGTKNLVF